MNIIFASIISFLAGLVVGSILWCWLMIYVLKEGEGFLGHFIHHHNEAHEHTYIDEEDC